MSPLGIVGVVGLIVLLVVGARFARKLAHFVRTNARLLEETHAEVLRLHAQHEALERLYRELQPGFGLPPMRGWAGSPDFLAYVAQQVKARRPGVVLECGSGVSTVVIARALQCVGTGRLISLEHDAHYAQRTEDELERTGLRDFVTIMVCPLVARTDLEHAATWYEVKAESLPSIDMLVIDGPPTHAEPMARYPALPVLFAHLREGASIMLDDADRPGERSTVARWKREFPAIAWHAEAAEKGLVVGEVVAPA